MSNTTQLKEIISDFTPLSPGQIDLNKTLKDYYIASEVKNNFCYRLLSRWPSLNSTDLVNNMFVTIKTGQDILNLIEPVL